MQLRIDTIEAPPRYGGAPQRLGRTFRETRRRPVHRWYSYVEGFSADYIVATLDNLASDRASIYDPFGGTGTALVEAARRRIPSFYAEANPFMAFVVDAKVNAGRWAARNKTLARSALVEFRDAVLDARFTQAASRTDVSAYHAAFPKRGFFEEGHLQQLVHALQLAEAVGASQPRAGQLATLACASNIVASSNMTRRADLRRRKPGEYKMRKVDVPGGIAGAVNDILADLDSLTGSQPPTTQVASDCRTLPATYRSRFDLAVTSPPYLNGTNYIRNTKLELVLLGFIRAESQLGSLRDAGVRGGITQAATSRGITHRIASVETIAERLDACAPDKRIPHMVRAYFSDMREVMGSVHASLKTGGCFILDIGDSKFYDVHVPTDRLLAEIAQEFGFVVERDAVIARRHSRDRTPLVQVDLHLRK
jgi:hypothetical protein